MKPFTYLYDRTIRWSAHRYAPYYLAGVSFAESSFFPIPPDIMLISMGLSAPHRSWHYALIATCFSVIGGMFGYLIGLMCMEFIQPYLLASSYAPQYEQVLKWFSQYGVGVVILAGFTPFPYKIFTIAAGAMHMAFFPFVVGSLVGRGLRFFLVSGLLFFFGENLEIKLRRYIDRMGWAILALCIAGYLFWLWRH